MCGCYQFAAKQLLKFSASSLRNSTESPRTPPKKNNKRHKR